ncbi:MAG: hypothetical protein LBF76_01530 [Holosporales bacterium]|jgi:hypothetical protein|nr:hypothetical protein [Holosporales bacterium]
MRRLFVGLLIGTSLSAWAMERPSEEGQIVALRQASQGFLAQQKTNVFIQLGEGNQVIVSFRKGMPVPCERELLGLENPDEEHTYPVYKLALQLPGFLQPFLLDRYVDKENPLPHERQILSVTDNDQREGTERCVNVYVWAEGKEHVLRQEVQYEPYPFMDRTEDRWDEKARFIVRDYTRSDRTKYSKDIDMFPHEEQILSVQDDDDSLSMKQCVETFVLIAGSRLSLKTEERTLPYPFTEREEDRRSQRLYALVRQYTRSNQSIFSRDTQTFPYQERVKTEDEDGSLSTKRTVETFVTWGTPYKVLMTEVRFVPYPFTDREEWQDEARVLEFWRDCYRSDGSVLKISQEKHLYQTRDIGQIFKDEMLCCETSTETFVTARGRDWVRRIETKEVPYLFIEEREEQQDASKALFLIHDYKRPDKQIVSRVHQIVPYEREEISCKDKDKVLATFRTFSTFARVRGVKKEISRSKEAIPYPCTVSYEDHQHRNDNTLVIEHYKISTYTRSIGTELEQRTFMGADSYPQEENGFWDTVVKVAVGAFSIAGIATGHVELVMATAP